VPRHTTSEAVMAILDSLTENYGSIELTPADAEQVFGGDKAVLVKDLNRDQLLQYALLHSHVQNQALIAQIEAMARPNRAARRAKKLITP